MIDGFHRNLSLLRQERRLSQRIAARELGVSQALLSHYENGVREPGLGFVVRACDYYGVSSDFLLGRSMSRDGTAIHVEDIHDSAEDKDNVMKGSVLAVLDKKLLVNTTGVIFDILGKYGSKRLITCAFNYLSTSLYKLFRHIYSAAGSNPDAFFSVPACAFPAAADSEMSLWEARFLAALDGQGVPSEQEPEQFGSVTLSHDTLGRDYPMLVQSLFNVLHSAGERIHKSL